MESNVCLCPLSSWDLTLPTLRLRQINLQLRQIHLEIKKKYIKKCLLVKQCLPLPTLQLGSDPPHFAAKINSAAAVVGQEAEEKTAK